MRDRQPMEYNSLVCIELDINQLYTTIYIKSKYVNDVIFFAIWTNISEKSLKRIKRKFAFLGKNRGG